MTVCALAFSLPAMGSGPATRAVQGQPLIPEAGCFTPSSPPWNLDRINSRAGDCDGSATQGSGYGVNVFILDTGIWEAHSAFANAPDRVRRIANFAAGDWPAGGDCVSGDPANRIGHGTAVAGVIGGAAHGPSPDNYGLAIHSRLNVVRIAPCSGPITVDSVVNGLTWVKNYIQQQRQSAAPLPYPAVVVLTAHFPLVPTTVVVHGAAHALIDEANVLLVLHAGNQGEDAGTYSPTLESWATTVGGTDISDYRLAETGATSNFGPVVDMFAPGKDIFVPFAGSATGKGYRTGTSFSAPHVAGVAALYLQNTPYASWMEVKFPLEDLATPNVVMNQGANTTRKMLYLPASPAAPTNVELRRESSTRIDISWLDNATTETGYAVGRRNLGQSNFTTIWAGGPHEGTGYIGIVDDNAPAFDSAGLSPDANQYEYRIEAQGGQFLPAYSVITSTQSLPTAASNVTAAAVSSTRINVTWMDNSTNESGFKIERRAAMSNDAWVQMVNHAPFGGTGSRNWFDNSVTFGKGYEYRILAHSATGHSGYSNKAIASTPNVYVRFEEVNSDLPESGAVQGSKRVVLEIVPNLPLTTPVAVGYFTWTESGPQWATPVDDFSYRSGSASFSSGAATGATIDIPVPKVDVFQDTVQEPNEKLELHFHNLVGAIPKPGQEQYHMHTFYIVDDDTRASVGTPAATAEGQQMSFPVTLDRSVSHEIRVGYQTLDGSATSPADYIGTTGTLTFAAGQTSKNVLIPTVDDSLDEYDTENIRLRITAVLNVHVLTAEASGTITDNDPLPAIAIADVSLAEGTGVMGFPVQLSVPSGKTVKINYATGNGTAVAGSDYVASAGTLTFAPGETTKTATVPLLDDLAVEDVEAFTVTLSVPVEVAITIGRGQATGRILPDGDVSRISAGDVSVTEADGVAANALVPVTLSAPHYLPVTVVYATVPGSASSLDFVAASGTLTIPPGSTSGTVTISITGDLSDEDPETVLLNLSLPNPPIIATTIHDGQGVVTIVDNDPPPTITMTTASAIEGNCGAGVLASTVSISPPSGKTIGWLFETDDHGDGAATPYVDYRPVSQSMSLTPGVATVSLPVSIISDRVDELDERVWAQLSNVTNGNVTSAQAALSILDDDTAPGLTGNDVAHGSDERRSLAPAGGVNWYGIGERARSSYEVVVEETAGAVASLASPIRLDLMSCNQANVHEASRAVGAGNVRSLRWESGPPDYEDRQDRLVRVMSACTTGCGGRGAYRLRAFETTYSISRFNNTGQQYTLVYLQNPTAYAIDVSIHFWDPAGLFLATRTQTLAPRASLAVDTRAVTSLSEKSGSITVSNTGRYGDLVGGAVGIDEALEMSFDTAMVPRPR